MNVLDLFKADNAFSVVDLTTSINTLPYVPGRIGSLKLFKPKPIPTTSVLIEKQEGKLVLLTSSPRGTAGTAMPRVKRNARPFLVPHFDANDFLEADSIQNVREFGSGDQVKGITTEVNNRLQALRTAHEVTHEFLRLGALKGNILDGDGVTVLYNLFTEFGISQPTISFALGTETTDVKAKCTSVLRTIQTALGATPFQGVLAICGDTFYDSLVSHATVKDAFRNQNDQASRFLIETQGQGYEAPRFEYGGIVFENYRGQVGDVKFVADNKCHFIPMGVPELFEQYHAPAPYIETVNTPGKPVYAKQVVTKFDTGVEFTSDSNFLPLCTRPGVLVEATL